MEQLRNNQLDREFERFERALLELEAGRSGCQFEWIDGPLVTAMKKGQWRLVENSNLCRASVLDRLNPLFEGAGRLQLAEKGMTRGGINTVTPHDDFRIIFAFNPRYGELSRAMRNRGVEIAFLPDPELTAFSPPIPLNHVLKLLLDRLLQSDIFTVVSSWAQFNRANHFLIGGAYDLALGSQMTQHLQDQNRALGHQSLLRLVIAASLPLRLVSHGSNSESNDPKNFIDQALFSVY
ncbi:hypothetical protein VP01_8242g1, partial [Puccinia sorghi]